MTFFESLVGPQHQDIYETTIFSTTNSLTPKEGSYDVRR